MLHEGRDGQSPSVQILVTKREVRAWKVNIEEILEAKDE